ncbi:MAG: helix-turn-helix domain-containing protein [Candidatus Aenigmarchaeota archaeon]|nr:helix-turn-helix domain-containing protein [Candidatus Aenigmarchaeota archaeon]
MEGSSQNKSSFLSDVRKIKSIRTILPVGNMFFTLNVESLQKSYYAPFFDRSLFQNKPIILKPDGYEYWEFASWGKKQLLNLMQKAPDVFDIQLVSLTKIKQGDIYIPKIFPDLTDRQRKALHIAIENGYYETPKRADMDKLAQQFGVSRQTYQEHLHSAERKLMSFIFENI